MPKHEDAHERDMYTFDDGSGYSQSDFYCRAVNKHDHAMQFNTRMPAEILAMVDDAITNFPAYHSRQDFVRDAIVHRLRYLNETILHDPSLDKWLRNEIRLANIERIDRINDTDTRLLDKMEEGLKRAVEIGDWLTGNKYLIEMTATVDDMVGPYLDRLLSLQAIYGPKIARLHTL